MRRRRLNPVLATFLTVPIGLVVLAWQADAAETALTPVRVIYPGETVEADAVEPVKLRRGARVQTAVATNPVQIAGKVAKRTLVPGKLIPVSALRDPFAVEAGSTVEAVFAKNGLSISLSAVALQSAGAGEQLRLRNAQTGKTFSGTAQADGTVRVGP
jgi:flagella basal body P-ring formation protein FlgA